MSTLTPDSRPTPEGPENRATSDAFVLDIVQQALRLSPAPLDVPLSEIDGYRTLAIMVHIVGLFEKQGIECPFDAHGGLTVRELQQEFWNAVIELQESRNVLDTVQAIPSTSDVLTSIAEASRSFLDLFRGQLKPPSTERKNEPATVNEGELDLETFLSQSFDERRASASKLSTVQLRQLQEKVEDEFTRVMGPDEPDKVRLQLVGEASGLLRALVEERLELESALFEGLETGPLADIITKIVERVGAKILGKIPEVEPGVFGDAKLAEIFAQQLEPSQGKRPGRPTNPSWVRRPQIPMGEETFRKLIWISSQMSSPARRVSPMQVAAQLLEDAVKQFIEQHPEQISE